MNENGKLYIPPKLKKALSENRTFSITKEMCDRIDDIAPDRPRAAVIRDALNEYFSRHSPKTGSLNINGICRTKYMC